MRINFLNSLKFLGFFLGLLGLFFEPMPAQAEMSYAGECCFRLTPSGGTPSDSTILRLDLISINSGFFALHGKRFKQGSGPPPALVTGTALVRDDDILFSFTGSGGEAELSTTTTARLAFISLLEWGDYYEVVTKEMDTAEVPPPLPIHTTVKVGSMVLIPCP